MLGCYLDPKNDYAFRRIFGDAKREPLLRRFLNSLLELKGEGQIERLHIADPHQIPRLKDSKETVLDVRCIDQRGREFIVEMQMLDQHDFEHRALYYVAKSFVGQLKRGDKYTQLRKVTLLSILDFAFLRNPHYLATHLILDKKTGEHKLKDFEFAFLELTKFHKPEQELQSLEDQWIYFLKHADQTPLRAIPSSLHNPDIEEAFGVLEEIGRNKHQTQLYDKAEMDRMDRLAQMDKRYEKGHQEGRQEGRQEEKQQIARAMRAKGLDEAMITEITGLTPEQLRALD